MRILGFTVVDDVGWPIEFYVGSPIRNFVRLVGLIVLRRARFSKRTLVSVVNELHDGLNDGSVVLARGSDPVG